MGELLLIARENNHILRRIECWVDKVDSPQHKKMEAVKAVAANMMADILMNNNFNRTT